MRHRHFALLILAFVVTIALIANAQQSGLIVRDKLGVSHLTELCGVLQCSVQMAIGDPQHQVFVVSSTTINLSVLLQLLSSLPGIVDVELNQTLNLQSPVLSYIPDSLFDNNPVNYYGTPVWNGYVAQPANSIVQTAITQTQFHVYGSGIVAVIDSGLDPRHPALAPVVLPGYDFTRNTSGADETGDLDHSTAAVLDNGGGCGPVYVSMQLAAAICPPAAAALGNPQYAAFGHGTMTAGIVHMVAPTAQILPLKAFSSNGSGQLSDVLRAIYYAATQGSKVINMSFSFYNYSTEMANAITYVNGRGVICVAAAGNDGEQISVYPASLTGVIGVASTTDYDSRSSFSNYGSQVVWVAAPGENIVSTYPYDTYASSSGTSFSAPFVAGAAALLVNMSTTISPTGAASAIAHAKYISSDLNHGRLDTNAAAQALQSPQ